jgi:hypothetical protein
VTDAHMFAWTGLGLGLCVSWLSFVPECTFNGRKPSLARAPGPEGGLTPSTEEMSHTQMRRLGSEQASRG